MSGAVGTSLRRVRNQARRLYLSGDSAWCPVCGRGAKRFLAEGEPVREQARCPWCGSLERHRLMWRYLDSGRPPRTVLHVAPERVLGAKLRARCDDYVSVDLKKGVDVRADITVPLPFPDGRFDTVVCSHVLEHIPDDTAAVRQLTRVMGEHGRLIVLVPVADADRTVEDLIDDPVARTAAYGQEDHVRMYGRDVVDRLRSCDLEVEVYSWRDVPAEEAARMHIDEAAGDVFVCRRSKA